MNPTYVQKPRSDSQPARRLAKRHLFAQTTSLALTGAFSVQLTLLPACGHEMADPERESRVNGLVEQSGKLGADQQHALTKIGEATTSRDEEWVCQNQEYDWVTTPEEWVALDANAPTMYPCALLQGKTVADGVFAPIPVPRAPSEIMLTIVSGSPGRVARVVVPSPGAALQAQNDILRDYQGGTPTFFSLGITRIYSETQLALAMNVNAKWLLGKVSASFKLDQNDKKSRVLVQFVQRAFTMACSPPQGAAGAFAPSVTEEDLRPYIGPGNPPVYMSSVSFGRGLYLLFESTESIDKLEAGVSAAVNVLFGKIGGEVSAAHRQVLQNSQLRIVAFGGDAEQVVANAASVAQDDKILFVKLLGNARFSKENPMVPISFSLSHLGDGSPVRLAMTTKYTAKDCTPIQAPPPRTPNVRLDGPTSVRGPWGGNGGSGIFGQAFTSYCPDQYVVTGILGRSGSFVEALGIRCAELRKDGTLGNTMDLPINGGSGGAPYLVSCPTGSAVTAFNGGAGFHLDHLDPLCTPVSGIPGASALPIGSAGGMTGPPFTSACPSGWAVNGIGGRAGDYMNSFMYFCREIKR